jgi:hypothetical protein
MKKVAFINTFIIIAVIIISSLTSCKKGDGDPFFSLLSRKQRLDGNWKISFLSLKYEAGKRTLEITFDGKNKAEYYTVRDSVFHVLLPDPHDSVADYYRDDFYTGQIIFDFDKAGTYYYKEDLTNDENGLAETSEIDGLWYFTGGNKHTKYKNKELLALQVTRYVFNPAYSESHTTTFQGENTLDIYEIYALKSNEVYLKVNKEETINFINCKTIMEIKLSPR